ncbi:hypothetical protein K2173_028455 [Erythroxylum novogranatense]|uniref:PUM-HD domain-containing protein n=1 Tax=Erythroxylum novogranatense TaxID=1862640 RepID=A0AAV8U262_9ROSI|nr:hypothetical protein K2173_028455 [Erythroxylum novogranatense]
MDQFGDQKQEAPAHTERLQDRAAGFPCENHFQFNHFTSAMQTSTPYEDLITTISRLRLSSNSQTSYPYSDSNGDALFRSVSGSQQHLPRGCSPIDMGDFGHRMAFDGIRGHAPVGSEDYGHMLPSSDVFSYPSQHIGGPFNNGNASPPRSRGTPRQESLQGFPNRLLSKNNKFANSNRTKTSHWLQEPSNYLSVKDLKGKIVTLAKDQHGCRFLQKKMTGITEEELLMVYSELIDYVAELMIDQYGNYVVQKLVEVCKEEQMTQILRNLTRHEHQLITICLDIHGTRSVQTLLHYVNTPQQISIVITALSLGAALLCKDPNGQHVVHYCVKNFSLEDIKHFLNMVAANCFEIATNKSGCCVLQHCVDHARGEIRDRLVAPIIANALELAQDPFGNYVVQHALSLKVPRITATLLAQLEGNFVSLSCNKYGSNVVEKCLAETKEEQLTQIITEIVQNQNAPMLLLDAFGNYVIQAALTHSMQGPGHVHLALVRMVLLHARLLRTHMYGKKVIEWFNKNKGSSPLMYL